MYQVLAVALLSFGMFLLYVHAHAEGGFSWIDFGIFATIALLFLALIRPSKFDLLIKTIADKMPFMSFKKDE